MPPNTPANRNMQGKEAQQVTHIACTNSREESRLFYFQYTPDSGLVLRGRGEFARQVFPIVDQHIRTYARSLGVEQQHRQGGLQLAVLVGRNVLSREDVLHPDPLE
jgi:hypothetical protein